MKILAKKSQNQAIARKMQREAEASKATGIIRCGSFENFIKHLKKACEG
ncbi:MAG: hypothetical protein ABIE14_00775 [Patescibacteria group bacterium]